MWQVSIGSNRGTARLWLQGKKLHDAGFIAKTTRYNVLIEKGRVTIASVEDGERRVSGKGDMPIIDINSAELLNVGRIGTKLEVTANNGSLTLVPVRKTVRKAA